MRLEIENIIVVNYSNHVQNTDILKSASLSVYHAHKITFVKLSFISSKLSLQSAEYDVGNTILTVPGRDSHQCENSSSIDELPEDLFTGNNSNPFFP